MSDNDELNSLFFDPSGEGNAIIPGVFEDSEEDGLVVPFLGGSLDTSVRNLEFVMPNGERIKVSNKAEKVGKVEEREEESDRKIVKKETLELERLTDLLIMYLKSLRIKWLTTTPEEYDIGVVRSNRYYVIIDPYDKVFKVSTKKGIPANFVGDLFQLLTVFCEKIDFQLFASGEYEEEKEELS